MLLAPLGDSRMRAVNIGRGRMGGRTKLGRCLAAKAAEGGRRHKRGSARQGGAAGDSSRISTSLLSMGESLNLAFSTRCEERVVQGVDRVIEADCWGLQRDVDAEGNSP